MSHYAIKYFNKEFFPRDKEIGSHFITKVLEVIKRISGVTLNKYSLKK